MLCTCSGWFKHIEPRRTFPNHIITEIAKCVNFCHMSSGWFDHTEPSLSTSLQGQQGMQGVVHLFGVVQAHRTLSNLLEPHHYRDSKVCRVLSHEFRVVRLYRTFSIYIVTGETRYAGCLCTCSGWFKQIEPHRTFSNHIITDIARSILHVDNLELWVKRLFASMDTIPQLPENVPPRLDDLFTFVACSRRQELNMFGNGPRHCYIVTGETRSAGCL